MDLSMGPWKNLGCKSLDGINGDSKNLECKELDDTNLKFQIFISVKI